MNSLNCFAYGYDKDKLINWLLLLFSYDSILDRQSQWIRNRVSTHRAILVRNCFFLQKRNKHTGLGKNLKQTLTKPFSFHSSKRRLNSVQWIMNLQTRFCLACDSGPCRKFPTLHRFQIFSVAANQRPFNTHFKNNWILKFMSQSS